MQHVSTNVGHLQANTIVRSFMYVFIVHYLFLKCKVYLSIIDTEKITVNYTFFIVVA
jgi:hypothetical protein